MSEADRLLCTIEVLQREINCNYAVNRASIRTYNAMLKCAEGWHPKLKKHLHMIYNCMFKRKSRLVEQELRAKQRKAERTAALLREISKDMDTLAAEVQHVAARVDGITQAEPRRARDSKAMLALMAECSHLRAERLKDRLKKLRGTSRD